MKKNLLFSALAVVALWLAWLIAYALVRNEYVLPSFWDACREVGRLLFGEGRAAFWRAFSGTLLRTVYAFLLSLVFGVGLALLSALSEKLRAFLAPVISLLRTVPTMAIILMLLIWTNAYTAPVVVSLLVLLPAFYAATLASLLDVREQYAELTLAFGVGWGRKVSMLYLPLGAPPILRQAGSIFSMGLKITVSGEVLSNTYRSLGALMQDAKMFLEMPRLMALTVVCILLGFLLEGCCLLAYRLIVRWRT